MDCHSLETLERSIAPRAIFDAGETRWPVLRDRVERRLEELVTGEVLEINSTEPNMEGDIRAWSSWSGHFFSLANPMSKVQRFWIVKR